MSVEDYAGGGLCPYTAWESVKGEKGEGSGEAEVN